MWRHGWERVRSALHRRCVGVDERRVYGRRVVASFTVEGWTGRQGAASEVPPAGVGGGCRSG